MPPRNRRYQPGEYFEQFLSNLPALIQQRENRQLQRERFEYQKQRDQQAFEIDEQNRALREQSAIDTANYRQFTIDRAKKTDDYNLFNQLYTSFTDNPEAQNKLIEQHPLMKSNPDIAESFREGLQINDEMKSMVYGFGSMRPEEGLVEARKALRSPYMTKNLYDVTTKYIKDATDQLTFTKEELANTKAGIEYAQLLDKFNNPSRYVPAGQDVNAFLTTTSQQMKEVYDEAKAEYDAGFGNYPTYDNVEDIKDEDLDDILTSFEVPFFDRFPIEKSGDNNTDRPADGRVNRAIQGQPVPETPNQFVQDDAGLERLVKEYAPSADLGFLQKAATEGSVVKPVEEPLFKAVTGGLDSLNRTLGQLDMAYDFGDVDSENLPYTYAEKADEFKKTVKDMYDIYLKLDPKKGAYKTKFRTGNQMMRKKIKNDLSRLKNAGMKALRFDKEIPQVLDSIKF